MLTREEGERMAEAIHRLRPDWPVASLFTFIGQRMTRPYRDLLLELAFVAVDPKTDTPARIDQDGPWKQLSRVNGPTDHSLRPIDFETACAECLNPPAHPWHGDSGRVHDHPFVPPQPPTPMPAGLRESLNQEETP
jgi:hypothetical protein